MDVMLTVLAALGLVVGSGDNQPPQRTVLWRNIYVGMPASEVAELYPAVRGTIRHNRSFSELENVQQIGRCRPDVYIYYRNGLVESVYIEARSHGYPPDTCGNEAQDALIAKYGPSMDEDESSRKGIVFVERQIRKSWIANGVKIVMKRNDPDGDNLWTIIYEAADTSGL